MKGNNPTRTKRPPRKYAAKAKPIGKGRATKGGKGKTLGKRSSFAKAEKWSNNGGFGGKRRGKPNGGKREPKKPIVSPREPKLTHKEQNRLKKEKKLQESNIGKIVVEEEFKKANPNLEKIREYLGKIHSRGTRQRLRNKLTRLEAAAK